MKTKDFDYYLPEELIAQHPLEERSSSRLMTLNINSGEIEHRHFYDVIDYLNEGDCLVINDTRVIPARLFGVKADTRAAVEFLLLKKVDGDLWEVLVKPGKKCRAGAVIEFGEGLLTAKIVDVLETGNRIVEFQYDGIFEEILDRIGTMPLPPYITQKLEDAERYQTIYSLHKGSAAAPTAGLHFTKELLEKVEQKGIKIARVTLHVGLGTFRPVKVEDVNDHVMHSESYVIDENAANIINSTKRNGGRVVSVGTTSTRVLETVADEDGFVKASSGETSIFIYPGIKLKCVDSLITNFHLPQSTLLMLVSALAGKENVLRAYETAVREKYRFFSFGDAMLLY